MSAERTGLRDRRETRVVCNPGGYNRVEGHEFDPVFVIDV